MEVRFYIDSSGGMNLPKAKSSELVNDCDLLDLLLSGDLSNLNKVIEFEHIVFKSNDVWWFDASRVEVTDGVAAIQAAFDVSAELKIKLKSLKLLIREWKVFLESKVEITIAI